MTSVAAHVRERAQATVVAAHEQRVLRRTLRARLGEITRSARAYPPGFEEVLPLPGEDGGSRVGRRREHRRVAQRPSGALHLGAIERQRRHMRPASSVRLRNSDVRTFCGAVKIFSGGPSSRIWPLCR